MKLWVASSVLVLLVGVSWGKQAPHLPNLSGIIFTGVSEVHPFEFAAGELGKCEIEEFNQIRVTTCSLEGTHLQVNGISTKFTRLSVIDGLSEVRQHLYHGLRGVRGIHGPIQQKVLLTANISRTEPNEVSGHLELVEFDIKSGFRATIPTHEN